MWDLKLNNNCNHRIINELLEIKGSYPAYYATLKRPVYGNNLKVKILDEDNLFANLRSIYNFLQFAYNNQEYTFYNENDITIDSVITTINNVQVKLKQNIDYTITKNSNAYTFKFINTSENILAQGTNITINYSYKGIEQIFLDYELGNDRKTIRLNTGNDTQVDVRDDVYPKHSYYATYSTDQSHCPKCIYGTNTTNDIYIDVLGRPVLTAGLERLIQSIKKIIITAIESNVFDETYGTELPNLIGKPKTVLTLLKAQNTIQNAIDYIKTEQIRNYDLLSDDEKLLKIDNFQVMPSDNPKILKFSFEVYNLSGKNVNIGVSI